MGVGEGGFVSICSISLVATGASEASIDGEEALLDDNHLPLHYFFEKVGTEPLDLMLYHLPGSLTRVSVYILGSLRGSATLMHEESS